MTDLDLDALEATARAATPGPWESWNVDDETIEVRAGSALADNGSYRSTDMIATYDVYGYELDEPDFVQTEANADHIATFDPTTVLALIARLREAEAVVEAVREAARYGSRMDPTPTRMPGPTVADSEAWWASWHLRADAAWRKNINEALSRYPTTKTEGSEG